MGRYQQAMKYSSAAGITAAAIATAPAGGVSGVDREACLDQLRALDGASVIELPGPGIEDSPHRLVLGCDAVASDTNTSTEELYLVRSQGFDAANVYGCSVEYVGLITWTYSGTARAGGRTDTKVPKAVGIVSSGLLEAMSGGGVVPKPYPAAGNVAKGGGVGVHIVDMGDAIAVLRLSTKGAAATSVHPRHALWK